MIKKIIATVCILSLLTSVIPTAFAMDFNETVKIENVEENSSAVAVTDERPVGGMVSECILDGVVLDTSEKSDDSKNGELSASSAFGDAQIDTYDSLYDALYSGMLAHSTSINVYSLRIPSSEFKTKIFNTYLKVLYDNANLMAYTGISGNSIGSYVSTINPGYLFTTAAADAEARTVVENGIQHYVDLAANIPASDIVGKMLVIHDAFCKDNVYATSELASYDTKDKAGTLTPDDWMIFTAYGLFNNKKAVCQGNSIALAAIYKRLGIEVGFCSSDEINHIWNVVKLDGKWYHLDETWNDTTVGSETNALSGTFHDYFLRATVDMQDHRNGGQDWEYFTDETVSCTSTDYNNGYIFNGGCVYDGTLIRTYYGTVSYDSSRYKVEIIAHHEIETDTSGNESIELYLRNWKPFYSTTVRSPGAILSDAYAFDDTHNAIEMYSNSTLSETEYIFSLYNDNRFVDCSIGTWATSVEQGEHRALKFPNTLTGLTFYVWDYYQTKPHTQKKSI